MVKERKDAHKERPDPEIMEMVLKAIDKNGSELSKKLDKTPMTIYHITSGKNYISEEIMKGICTLYPFINYLFMKNGTLPVRLDELDTKAQINIFGSADIPTDTALLIEIRDLLKIIAAK